MRSIELFGIYAKIALDTSDFESGVKDAKKDGESLAGQLKDGLSNAADKAEKSMKDAGDSADNMSGGFTIAKGVIANLVSGGIQLAISAFGNLLSTIWNLDEATEEYRIAMGKLNTAYEAAGYSSGVANQAFTSFYGILGDVDTATEASQLLAKLADNEEDVATWTNIAAGVYGTFGDSLPIEGLIEAANETAKTGVVTGVFADALNWAGISEDEFNAKLAACGTEAERNQLIMDTLNGTYSEAADTFYENNDALVETRENQIRLQDAMAKVGESIQNLKTGLLNALLPTIERVAAAFSDFISNLDIDAIAENIENFIDFIMQNGSTIISIIAGIGAGFAAWKITSLVTSAISAISGLIPALTAAATAQGGLNVAMAANPIGLIVTLITSLIAILVTLWTTNEGFRNAVIGIWENIKAVFTDAWEAIKSAWDEAQPYFQAIWNTIQTIFSVAADVLGKFFSDAWNAIQIIWNVVGGYFENVWNTIAGIFSVVQSVLSGDFQGAWDAIKGIFSGWKDYFTGLWDTLTGIFENAYDWFVGIGEDIVNGIWKGIQNIWGNLTKWFNDRWNDLVGGVTNLLGIHSPSKVFAGIGENMALGVGEGWDSEFDRIRAQIENGMNFDTASVDFRSSGIGVSSAGVINGLNFAAQSGAGGEYVINLVLPDGSRLASYLLNPLADYAKANGTPILNPI